MSALTQKRRNFTNTFLLVHHLGFAGICGLLSLETGSSGRHFERGQDSGNDVSIFGVLVREGQNRAVVLECLENWRLFLENHHGI